MIGVIILRINLLMTNKCKRIKKNTKHFFVLSGREELYFREEVAVCFKPLNRTYPPPHAAKPAPPPPSRPPSTTTANITPTPSYSPSHRPTINSSLKQTTGRESPSPSSKSRTSYPIDNSARAQAQKQAQILRRLQGTLRGL